LPQPELGFEFCPKLIHTLQIEVMEEFSGDSGIDFPSWGLDAKSLIGMVETFTKLLVEEVLLPLPFGPPDLRGTNEEGLFC
jgi:hypothetical protein